MTYKPEDLSKKIQGLRRQFEALEKSPVLSGDSDMRRRRKRGISRLQNQLSGTVCHAIDTLNLTEPNNKTAVMLGLCELAAWGKPAAAKQAVGKAKNHDMAYMAAASAIGGKGGRCALGNLRAILLVVVKTDGDEAPRPLLTPHDLEKMASRANLMGRKEIPPLIAACRNDVFVLSHLNSAGGTAVSQPPI